MSKFKAFRENGKSDSQILVELIGDSKPDDVFTYEHLANLLESGTDRTLGRDKITSIVSQAKKPILQETKRALINIRGVGYRVAEAREHRLVSKKHKNKALNQMRISRDTLKYINVDEMSQEEQARCSEELVHNGKLVNILSGHESRIAEHHEAIQQIKDVLVDAKNRGKL